MRILKPMRIRTRPPINSAFSLRWYPNLLPIFSPNTQNTKVTKPIKEASKKIFSSKKAMLTPIAKASMLVASAKKLMVLCEKSAQESSHSSFFCLDSFIIFKPIKESKIKAM